MKYLHIATGPHMSGPDPRFRINTAPGVMEPTRGVNEAHGSYLERPHVIELRDELNEWLRANPTAEELQEAHDRQVRAQALRDAADDLEGLVDSQHPKALNPDTWLRDRADAEESNG